MLVLLVWKCKSNVSATHYTGTGVFSDVHMLGLMYAGELCYWSWEMAGEMAGGDGWGDGGRDGCLLNTGSWEK